MSVELFTEDAQVTWEQPPQLSDKFSHVEVTMQYPDTFAEIGNGWRRTDPAGARTQIIFRNLSASSGVIFSVCNDFGPLGDSLDDGWGYECIRQTLDISPSQIADTRGPIIDSNFEVTPTSIDPGDVVTATLRIQDISGIAEDEDGFSARFGAFADNDQFVSLIQDGAETVVILQARFPASEYGCGEFMLRLFVSDSLGNQSEVRYNIEVSCGTPPPTEPPV
jgi:hypothetical protein